MQRYFVKKIDDKIIFNQQDIFHIQKVMRMKINDQIEIVFDDKAYLVKIISFVPDFNIEIINQIDQNPELKNNITLYYCIPKGDKINLVIEKAVELGIKEIILVNSSRTIGKINDSNIDKKLEHFRKIIKESSEQSKRNNLMKIDKVINYNDIFKNVDSDSLNLIAYEKEKNTVNDFLNILIKNKSNNINVIVGAEGGFSEEEVDLAIKNNFKSISLGKRILRSETACFYVLSLLSFYSELN